MAYYARGRLQDAILGSTPRRLLHRSKIPVMLVRLPEDCQDFAFYGHRAASQRQVLNEKEES